MAAEFCLRSCCVSGHGLCAWAPPHDLQRCAHGQGGATSLPAEP